MTSTRHLNRAALDDLDILKFGNEIELVGAIYAGEGAAHLCVLPSESLEGLRLTVLEMDADGWDAFLRQTDVGFVEGPGKALIRKSQRVIDNHARWAAFRRDRFTCRYCGAADRPLTVDHVDLWEDGGASVLANFVTACSPCNRARGRTPYAEWLVSNEYRSRAKGLDFSVMQMNLSLLAHLPGLAALRQERRAR